MNMSINPDILVGLALACLVGCSHEGYPAPSRFDAEGAGRAAIVEYDTNGDGKISGRELNRCPGVKAAINQIDPSGNGEVTSETITARLRAWEKSKVGRISLWCRVVHNGRPVPDAEVKFVPEKFLGPYTGTATGTTDKNGVAIMCERGSIAAGGAQGIATGFYRIEITKRGVNIPAKYNKDSILGLEIAIDADWITKCGGKPIEFDLKY
jgi:hypothetical protein